MYISWPFSFWSVYKRALYVRGVGMTSKIGFHDNNESSVPLYSISGGWHMDNFDLSSSFCLCPSLLAISAHTYTQSIWEKLTISTHYLAAVAVLAVDVWYSELEEKVAAAVVAPQHWPHGHEHGPAVSYALHWHQVPIRTHSESSVYSLIA